MKEDCVINSDLKVYTCESSKRKEECIGILKLTNEDKMSSSQVSSSIEGQPFVACSSFQPPENCFIKIGEEEFKKSPFFQNYKKGNPSKVSNYKIIIV